MKNGFFSPLNRACVGPLGLENRRSLVRSPARPICFPRIADDSFLFLHSIVSTMVVWESSQWCGKNFVPSTGKKNYLQESMNRCTGRRDIPEIILKTVLTLSQTSPGFYVSAITVFFENTVGKGEIAHDEQFLLFPQCFLLI